MVLRQSSRGVAGFICLRKIMSMNVSTQTPDLSFDYYYGQEAEQFVFYRIPKLLIKDEAFRGLSNDAKLLYGLLLDRMSLSRKNHWFDEKNRTFIIYSIEEIMADLNCSRGKAVKSMAELDTKNGIGLVEKVRRGMGQPNILYVKNFIRKDSNGHPSEIDPLSSPPDTPVSDQPQTPPEAPENTQSSKFYTSRSLNFEHQEVQNINPMKSIPHTSFGSKSKLQKVQDLDGNNSYSNYIDCNDIEKRNLPHSNHAGERKDSHSLDGMLSCESSIQTLNQSVYESSKGVLQEPVLQEPVLHGSSTSDETDLKKKIAILDQIRENIEWNHLLTYATPDERSLYTTLFAIIEDTLLSDSAKLMIGGQSYHRMLVENRLLSLTSEHFRYIYDSMRHASSPISNTYGYLLSALFHAPVTMDQYYSHQITWEQSRCS